MLDLCSVCYLVASISWSLAADLKNTHFINPPAAGSNTFFAEDVTFNLYSNEKLRWTTDISNYSIFLWQQVLSEAAAKPGEAIFAKAPVQAEPGQVTWNVSLIGQPLLLSDSNVFFLALGPNKTLGDYTATSHYFNITSERAATTTTFTSGPTATVPPATDSTSTPIVTPVPSSSSSSAVKIGLGVGLGVGIPIILLLGALVFFRWRSSRQHAGLGQNKSDSPTWQPMLPPDGATQEGAPIHPDAYKMNDFSQAQRASEMMAEGTMRSELPSERLPEEPSELATYGNR